MKAQIYRFKITYDGYEEILKRTVDVSSNYLLSRLGYLVLASFDTLAYHLFEMSYRDKRYEITLEDDAFALEDDAFAEGSIDPRGVALKQLDLEIGSVIRMVYDYGCDQRFTIELVDILEMKKGTSTKYPRIIAGMGKGILDDVSPYDFGKIVQKIKKSEKSTHTYIAPSGETEVWDYRDFDLDKANNTLKRDIANIEIGFEG